MEIKLAEGESFNVEGGNGIEVNGSPIGGGGGGGGSVETDGKDISPSSITLHASYPYDRTVTLSGDGPFSIYEEGDVSKDCYLDMSLSDVAWVINAEERDYRSVSANYSGKRIFLSCYNYQNDTYRELEIDILGGTITYDGPEGYVSGSIYDLLFKAFGAGE